jgi:hypothetical protein
MIGTVTVDRLLTLVDLANATEAESGQLLTTSFTAVHMAALQNGASFDSSGRPRVDRGQTRCLLGVATNQ